MRGIRSGMSLVAVAKILKPRGVRGEVWVDRYREGFPAFEEGSDLWLSGEPGVPRRVLAFFQYAKGCVLKIDGVDRPEAAAALSGQEVLLPEDWIPPGEPEEFEAGEVRGWAVVDARRGTLGTVSSVVPGPAYWTFLVEGPGGAEIEIPAVKGYGTELDRERNQIRVDLPEGFPGVDDED